MRATTSSMHATWRPLASPRSACCSTRSCFSGCRTTKLDAWSMNAFGSPGSPPLAELGVDVQFGKHVLAARKAKAFDPRIEQRVFAFRTFPGLDPSLLNAALDTGVRGMLIEAFAAGNVPSLENSLIPVIERASARDVPVVIVSQHSRGAVDLRLYAGGSAAAKAGAVGARDMTAEAALATLMVSLGRAEDRSRRERVAEAFTELWAGEWG